MDKRGQFFIISALVLAGILISFGTIYVSMRAPSAEGTRIYDLSREINFEASKIIDSGIFEGSSAEEISSRINGLLSHYANNFTSPETEMVFIYGAGDSLLINRYAPQESGGAGIGTGGVASKIPILMSTKKFTTEKTSESNGKINISIDSTSFNFDLKKGENFFVILQEQGADRNVASA